MKLKSELLIPCFCAIALAIIVWSGTFGIRSQLAYASLLGGDTVSDQNNLGKILVNKTSNGQSNEKSNDQQNQQLQPEELQGDNNAADQVSKPSENVKQSIADSELASRLFPYILDHLDSTTLLKQIDGKELFEKLILPHLQVSLTGDSQTASAAGERAGKTLLSVQTPSCVDTSLDSKNWKFATGGGAQIDVDTRNINAVIGSQLPDDRLVASRPGNLPNTWRVQAIIEGHDVVTAYVNCKGIQVKYVP
jgi:hypothetical protein